MNDTSLLSGLPATATLNDCARRRQKLCGIMQENSIAILPTAQQAIRNRDVYYPFRPESDFFYLTAFHEPDAVAIFQPGDSQAEYILFCRDKDAQKELWDGPRVGLQLACELFGADSAHDIRQLTELLPALLQNKSCIYYNFGSHAKLDELLPQWANRMRNRNRNGGSAPDRFVALQSVTHEMRLYKSRHEIATMRRAAKISAQAHRQAMQVCHPGMKEYQLEAELIHSFTHQGARHTAYPSIVGSGENSCILHYIDNHKTLRAGDLVLIDAGAEFAGYASDITRTFPVNGKFSNAQRAIYDIVLRAQRAAIATIRPGTHWNEPQQAAVQVITEGLIDLGILRGNVATLIAQGSYRKYYMHHIGHWLGIDVHDVGDCKVDGEWRMLEAGMVLTVEPGLYLRAGTPGLEKQWHNIGVRIEDDVLVTAQGRDVLSKDAPKEMDEIEALMADAA